MTIKVIDQIQWLTIKKSSHNPRKQRAEEEEEEEEEEGGRSPGSGPAPGKETLSIDTPSRAKP